MKEDKSLRERVSILEHSLSSISSDLVTIKNNYAGIENYENQVMSKIDKLTELLIGNEDEKRVGLVEEVIFLKESVAQLVNIKNFGWYFLKIILAMGTAITSLLLFKNHIVSLLKHIF